MANTPPVVVAIFGDTKDVQAKLAQVNAAIGGFTGGVTSGSATAGGAMTSLRRKILATAAAYLSLRTAVGLWRSAMAKSAEAETIKLQFETILGSVEKARERFEYLAEFAATTPFQLPGLARSSRILEVLTKGSLSTGKGLTMVGDVAAATSERFEDLAVHVGRMYSALMEGRKVGRSMRRLQMIGIFDNDTRNNIEAAQKAGKKGQEVWAIAERQLMKFSGSMAKLSQTWAGLWSTIKDNYSAVMREFGKPIQAYIKPYLKSTITTLQGMREGAAEFGEKVGRAIGRVLQAVKALKGLAKSGDLINVIIIALGVGFKMLVNLLEKAIMSIIRPIMGAFIGMFRLLTTKKFWSGVLDYILGLGMQLDGLVLQFAAGVVDATSRFTIPIRTAVKYAWEKLRDGMKLASLTLMAGLLRAADAFLEKLEQIPGIEKVLGGRIGGAREGIGERLAIAEEAMSEAMLGLAKTWGETRAEVEESTQGIVDVLMRKGIDMEKLGAQLRERGAGAIGPEWQDKMVGALVEQYEKIGASSIFDNQADMDLIKGMVGKYFGEIPKIMERTKDEIKKAGGVQGAEGGGVQSAQSLTGDALAAIGGGGRVFGRTAAVAQQQLEEAKLQSALMEEMRDSLGKTVQVEVG